MCQVVASLNVNCIAPLHILIKYINFAAASCGGGSAKRAKDK